MTISVTGQNNNFIDPSGIYEYDGETVNKDGETYGYFGTIKVLRLDSNQILVSFYICKGAPSYNSGSFVNTLKYSNNRAIHRGDTTEPLSTCRLIFNFNREGIWTELFSDNINGACGFGHAVDAEGFYKKVKGKLPTKEEILESEN